MGFQKISMLLLAVVLAIGAAEAQQNVPSCATKLVPCANYLNSTNPPASCCDPVKQAVTTERQCLCNLYNSPGFLQSIGITTAQVTRVARACGVNANVSMCKESAQSPTSSPPGLPGSDNNGARGLGWPAVSSVLLLSATIVLY